MNDNKKNPPLTRIVTDQLMYAREYYAGGTLVRVLAPLFWLMFLICLLDIDASASNTHGYTWTEIGNTSKQYVTVRAINSSNVVAGQIDGSAFILSDGRMIRYSSSSLDNPSSEESIALSINDSNTAVGSMGSFVPFPEAGGIQSTAAVFRDGKTLVIDETINVSFSANAVNSGTIVGGMGDVGFIRHPESAVKTVAPLSARKDYPNSNGLQITSINGIGDVAGASTINIAKSAVAPSAYPVHAFVRLAGQKMCLPHCVVVSQRVVRFNLFNFSFRGVLGIVGKAYLS